MKAEFPIKITGNVTRSRGDGKRLGYPTANIPLDLETFSNLQGIFISEVLLEDKKYQAVTFLGSPPSFKNADFAAETLLLNYEGADFYESKIEVTLLKYIREICHFEDLTELKKQIERDIESARNYFSGLC